jgi:hypothetical protein
MVAVLGAGLLGVVDYRILIGVTVTAILAGGLLAAFAQPRPVGE